MTTPVLTLPERNNIESGPWFSKLSPALRQAILSRATVRRIPDGTQLSSRGEPAEAWIGVAKGAVRVSSVSLAGKQVTLTYVEPGIWFGDIALFDGLPRTHDAHAHGETTLLVVRKPDFTELLSQHVELYDALLRMNCRRLRLMFDLVEDLNTLPLAARLAKQLLLLARSYGVSQGEEIRIGCSSHRKTWRTCSEHRGSGSTRNSRTSSARARCASSRRASSCSRKKNSWRSPRDSPRLLRRQRIASSST